MNEKFTSQTKAVTIEEVKTAIDAINNGNCFDINASRIRLHLGHGSNATVQKHLNTLRDNAKSALNTELLDDLPEMPIIQMQAVWTVAAAFAKKGSYERLIQLQKEKDEATQLAISTEKDLTSTNLEIDSLRMQFEELEFLMLQCTSQAQDKDQQSKQELQTQSELHMLEIQSLSEQIRSLTHALSTAIHERELDKLRFTAEITSLERIIMQHSEHQAKLQKLLDQLKPAQQLHCRTD
jgi:Plasmid replication region DNA-binding N-term